MEGRETISILNQHIDDEHGVYRIRIGTHIGYLIIRTDVFDEDTMCRPYLLVPRLPEFPREPWTRMNITRQCDAATPGALAVSVTNDPLPEIDCAWHHNRVDVLSLKEVKRHRSTVHEVLYNGMPAISKIAALDWQIPAIERETWAYSLLDQHQQDDSGRRISPRVLGHLTECGRVIGLLLERLEGEFASADDLPECVKTVERLHEIGLTHGDVNRYNFLVNKERDCVSMVDFEHASAFEEEAAKMELESLQAELEESTGRGGPSRVVWGTNPQRQQ